MLYDSANISPNTWFFNFNMISELRLEDVELET